MTLLRRVLAALLCFGLAAALHAAPAVSGNIAAVGHHAVIKVLQTDALPADGMAPVVVKGAKGEFVDFQVFVAHAKGGALLDKLGREGR